MAQPARTKIVVSCPTGSNRFVVGGGSELRLYEWEVSVSLQRVSSAE